MGGFWAIWGGGCVFFCEPDKLGVNDSQFDLVDTFPKCVFWRQGSLIQSEGRQFPMVVIPDDFPMGIILKFINFHLNVEVPSF